MTVMEMEKLAEELAKFHQLDHILVGAIIDTESNWDTFAIRHESHYKYILNAEIHAKRCRTTQNTEIMLQSCSLGLMQVMGGVARELLWNDPLPRLFEPEIGIKLGCMKLEQLSKRHKLQEDIIAAYNAGSPRKIGSIYTNQGYVNKVLTRYKERRRGALQ